MLLVYQVKLMNYVINKDSLQIQEYVKLHKYFIVIHKENIQIHQDNFAKINKNYHLQIKCVKRLNHTTHIIIHSMHKCIVSYYKVIIML